MASIIDLIPQSQRKGQEPAPQGEWFALVVKPIPVLLTDACWVTFPEVSPDNLWGPCRWEPRIKEVNTNVAESPESAHNILIGRILLPKAGDEALVAFDNRRQPWIVRWWPV